MPMLAAPALELDEQGQYGPAGDDHRHRWRDRDEPAPVVVGMPGRDREDTSLPRAPLSSRQQGRRRLPRDGGPPALGSRRRRHHAATVAASLDQEEARRGGQPGRDPSAAVFSKKASAPSSENASSPSSSGASSPAALLCAVCLEEVRRGEAAAALPCSHSYHPGCVLPWLAAHGACPCCRAAVPSPAGRRSTNL